MERSPKRSLISFNASCYRALTWCSISTQAERRSNSCPGAPRMFYRNKAQEKAAFAAVEAFSAPWSVKMLEIDHVGMYDTAAEEVGKVFITTELGGGGSSTAETVRIARRGVTNVVRHAGILDRSIETARTTWLDMPGGCFSFAEGDGLVETMVDLGEPIEQGQVIARIHPTGRTGLAVQEVKAGISGLLAARHFPGLVQAGDCLSVVAVRTR